MYTGIGSEHDQWCNNVRYNIYKGAEWCKRLCSQMSGAQDHVLLPTLISTLPSILKQCICTVTVCRLEFQASNIHWHPSMLGMNATLQHNKWKCCYMRRVYWHAYRYNKKHLWNNLSIYYTSTCIYNYHMHNSVVWIRSNELLRSAWPLGLSIMHDPLVIIYCMNQYL